MKWLGRKRIPPLPKETVLTDRSDGNTYKVVKSGDSPALSEITSINLRTHWVYGAYEGPTVEDDNGKLQRLYSDNGTLAFEAAGKHERHPPVVAIESRRPLEVWQVTIESGSLSMSEF